MENPAILWLNVGLLLSLRFEHTQTHMHTKLRWTPDSTEGDSILLLISAETRSHPRSSWKDFLAVPRLTIFPGPRHCTQTQSNNRGWKSLGKRMNKTMKPSSSAVIKKRKGVSFCTVELAISVRVAFKFRAILPVFALLEVFTQCLPVLLKDWTLSEGKSKLPAGSQGPDEMYLHCALSFSTQW